MKSEDYWNAFVSSGKVADYLRYRQDVNASNSTQNVGDKEQDERNHNSNRDGDSVSTNQRIR